LAEPLRMERAAAESLHLYEVLFQSVDDGITVHDAEGRLVFANAAGSRLLGYSSPEALLGEVTDTLVAQYEIMDEAGSALEVSALPGRRALKGEDPPEVTVRFRRRGTVEDQWAVVQALRVTDDRGHLQFIISFFRNITQLKRAEQDREQLLEHEHAARAEAERAQQRLEFLVEVGTVLASSLDYQTTLSSLARLAVPRLGDWCAIHILEQGDIVHQLAVAHEDPEKVALAHELEQRFPYDPDSPNGVPQVMRTGKAEMTSDITDEMLSAVVEDPELLALVRALGFTSSIIVPLIARGRVLGAITLVAAESGHHYDQSDLRLAEELASRAALAVDNARLYRESQRAAAEQAAVLAQMADGVVMSDTEGRIVYVNEAGQSLLGMSPVGQTIDTAITGFSARERNGDPAAAGDGALTRVLQGDTVINLERRLRRPDDSEVVVQTSASPLIADDGTMLGAVAVFHDVTEERELEQQKDNFLAAAAHDLKTPLASIKGLAQLLQRRALRAGLPETVPVVEGLRKIDAAVTRMNGLVNDLLDVSRIQMGRPLELNSGPADLVGLLRRVVSECQQATGGRHRIIVRSAVPELAGVWDADRLDRVFINLIGNAIKYSPSGGDIDVAIALEPRSDGPMAVVVIHDEGMGIPTEDVPRVFERFYRGRNVDTQIQGTGIGLAGAKQIVEQHGGTIDVESEEGQGSTFIVHLPLSYRQPRIEDVRTANA
jgi:PAS domain S-box-containing protein